MMPQNKTLIGILCVIGAGFNFVIMDMFVKLLSDDYPLHQIILIRSMVALAITAFIFVPLDGGFSILKTTHLKLHLLRGITVFIANMAFFTALASMPLGETTAIAFIAPLLITVFSVLILKEFVGPRRWTAVIIGLAGAIIMLRPGTDAFQLVAILPMIAALAYALLQIFTRMLGQSDTAASMAFYLQLTFIVISIFIGIGVGDGRYAGTGNASLDFLLRAWVKPDWYGLLIMAGVGVTAAIGGYLIGQGYRLCEAGLAAPFEYVSLPFAIIIGMLIWGEWPDNIAWLGIALITGAGLYIIYREIQLGKMPIAK